MNQNNALVIRFFIGEISPKNEIKMKMKWLWRVPITRRKGRKKKKKEWKLEFLCIFYSVCSNKYRRLIKRFALNISFKSHIWLNPLRGDHHFFSISCHKWLPLRLNVFICDEIFQLMTKIKGLRLVQTSFFGEEKIPKFTIFQWKKTWNHDVYTLDHKFFHFANIWWVSKNSTFLSDL